MNRVIIKKTINFKILIKNFSLGLYLFLSIINIFQLRIFKYNVSTIQWIWIFLSLLIKGIIFYYLNFYFKRNKIIKQIEIYNRREFISFDRRNLFENYISQGFILIWYAFNTIMPLIILLIYPFTTSPSFFTIYYVKLFIELFFYIFITQFLIHYLLYAKKLTIQSILKISRKDNIYLIGLDKKLYNLIKLKILDGEINDRTRFNIIINYIIIPIVLFIINLISILYHIMISISSNIFLNFFFFLINLIFSINLILFGLYQNYNYEKSKKNYIWIFDILKEIKKKN